MAAISVSCAAVRVRGCGRCCSPAIPCARCGGRGSTSISAITSSRDLRLRTGAFLAIPHAVCAVTHLAALCRLLPERDPHADVCGALETVLDRLDDSRAAGARVVRFELGLLAELGFGLDLARLRGDRQQIDLAYVSPKTGRAVSREAGDPWRDRLLRLPAFLGDRKGRRRSRSQDDLAAAFALTGFFLVRHVLEPRGLALADAREGFIAAILNRRQRRIAI